MGGTGYGEVGVGVRDQAGALAAVGRHLGPTLGLAGARTLTPFGHYASVVQVRDDLAIAICTDGVGTKTIVASMLDRYDTIGFDCVAMNVNDLLCVGARPVAMVDYLGVNSLDERRADAILEGLGRAAAVAGIAIPGGEIAQLPEIIGSDGRTPGDERAFDLVGTSIGTVHPERTILGGAIRPGDALIGLASSGIHSNGLTLARRVLLGSGAYRLEDEVGVLGRTLGEELLEPTLIYVKGITAMWDAGIETRGLAHITGDGLANLRRLKREVGYVIEELPQPPAIFGLIQETGGIGNEEMFNVFNMGTGFVAIVPDGEVDAAIERAGAAGYGARRIGTVVDDPGLLRIEPAGS
ncbi:phosphoribosylformylglycinamidine cyclo-ligase [soil metagenome]